VSADDEASLSEITILPDGLIYLFGASRQVLEVLNTLCGTEGVLDERLDRLSAAQPQPESNVGSVEE
jgi:hypothetical protein